MPEHDNHDVRPRTAVLTRGFDPSLSFGSARPAVFRSSTYVFPSPEAAERAFAITTGKIQPAHGRARRPDLFALLPSQRRNSGRPDRAARSRRARDAAVFNSGMAAIMTAFFAFARPGSTIVYTTPLYGGTTGLIHTFLEPFGVRGIPVPSGDCRRPSTHAIRSAPNCCIVFLETPANPTLIMTDIERAAERRRAASRQAGGHGGQHLPRARRSSTRCCWAPTSSLYSATKYLSGFSDMVAGVAITKSAETDPQDPQPPQHVRQHPAARRVLDAGRPPAHRGAAHEPAEQERAAPGRGACTATSN